jgi:LuxR family maltose regulon positive regulatory protein
MLLTKLHIPAPGDKLVSRTRLFQLLDQGLQRKLTLISAPAGYGKTMLLSHWITKNKIPAAWYSISSRDAEPQAFLTLIIQSFQTLHPEAGKKALEILHSPQEPNLDYVLDMFLNDLLQISQDLLLVLDDFHLVATAEISELIAYLLDNFPEKIHLALATRSDPPLQLARLRSQHQLVEIRAADLSFSGPDIGYYFNKKLNISLSDNDIELLQQKTEGWIAGLQLTAITLHDKQDVTAYLTRLAGDNRYIMDYLLEEVLQAQTQEITEFLLKTSVLDMFCSSLCNYILEKNDSQQLLEKLEKENLFLVPLDDVRTWFRYHHLFADLLKIRFKSSPKTTVEAVHERASLWFEQNHMTEDAIEHALQAGDYPRAMQLLDTALAGYWENGKNGEIIRFCAAIPEQELLLNQRITVFYGWALVILGEIIKAELLLQKLESMVKKDDQEILGKIYIAFNLLYTFAGDIRKAFHYSDLALQNLSTVDLQWNLWAYISHGEACHCRLDLDQAIESWNYALDNCYKIGKSYLILICNIEMAYSLLLKGRFREAYQLCLDQIETIAPAGSEDHHNLEIFNSMFYCMAGYVLAEWNQTEKAIDLGEKGFNLSRKTNNISFIGYCDWLLANIYVKTNEYEKAQPLLQEIEQDQRMTQLLTGLGYSLSAKIKLLEKDFNAASVLLSKENLRNDIINEYETVAVKTARARYYLEDYQTDAAITILEALKELTEKKEAREMLIEVLVLLTRAWLQKRNQETAFEHLVSAIILAQDEHYIRIFLPEAEELEPILKTLLRSTTHQKIKKDYMQKLLAAFGAEKKKKSNLDQLLSERELETLKLMDEDLTNQDIADRLFISLNTVKTHLKNINLKLETNSRNQAVEKARSLKLL